MPDETAPAHRPTAGPTLLGLQAVALGATGVAVLAGGFGVGSGVLRVGVGLLFFALGAISAGIGVSLSEGQPQAGGAALVFDGFVLALAMLWVAPVPTLLALGGAVVAGGALAAVAAGTGRPGRFALTSRPDARLELRHGVDADRARGARP